MDLFMTKRELYLKVENIRKTLGIDKNKYPISMFFESAFIPNLDIQYHNFKSKKLGGVLMHGDKIDTMILNSNRTPIEREFDCAHELIHLYEHRGAGTMFNCLDKKYVRSLSKIDVVLEWQANEGAAELLLPWKLFIPDVINEYRATKVDFDKSPIVNYFLSKKYGVTESIIEYRIENLRYEIIQFLDGKSLDNIDIFSNNQIKKYGINTKGYLDILNNIK